MNRLSGRSSRLIAAQAALVLVLCILLYIVLLQPNAPSPLSTGSLPGGPNAGTHNHTGHGTSVNNNQLPGPYQTASSPGSGNGGGGTPLIVSPPIPPSGPPSPGGDQYSSAVTALKAKLGLAPAGVP